jgi:serine/threonine protein kinase
MNKLLGKSSSNLVKIRDFFLFQAKEFTSQGFSSIEERTAIIVAEFYTGPSLMRFIREHWETLSNDQFRDLLCQVAAALAQLHEEAIVHR